MRHFLIVFFQSFNSLILCQSTAVDFSEQGNITEIVSLYHIAETQSCGAGVLSNSRT